MAQVSLPNPYGWNKSWKLRKLDYHSPAVDQKSDRPLELKFTNGTWSLCLSLSPHSKTFLTDHHNKMIISDKQETLPKLASSTQPGLELYKTSSFLNHIHQQSTSKLLGSTSTDPHGCSFQPQSPALSRVLFFRKTWLFPPPRRHASTSLINAYVGSQP